MEGIVFVIVFILLLLLLALIFQSFFKDYLPEVFEITGGLGLTIADIKSDGQESFIGKHTWEDAWPYIFFASAGLLITGIAISMYRNRKRETLKQLSVTIKNLEKKIEKIKHDYYRLCSDKIKWTFPAFFADGDARISIYQHQGDHFTLLGRYSNNQAFNRINRAIYPDSDGFISLGWQRHEFEDQDAPPWKGKGQQYKTYMKSKCKVNDTMLNSIGMKSCSFYIRTLHDPSTSQDPDGIIVFEKISPRSIDVNTVKTQLASKEIEILSFLRNMKSLTKKLER